MREEQTCMSVRCVSCARVYVAQRARTSASLHSFLNHHPIIVRVACLCHPSYDCIPSSTHTLKTHTVYSYYLPYSFTHHIRIVPQCTRLWSRGKQRPQYQKHTFAYYVATCQSTFSKSKTIHLYGVTHWRVNLPPIRTYLPMRIPFPAVVVTLKSHTSRQSV